MSASTLKKYWSLYGEMVCVISFGVLCIVLALIIPGFTDWIQAPDEETKAPPPTEIMTTNYTHTDTIISNGESIRAIPFSNYQADMQRLEDWYVEKMSLQYEQLSHQMDWWLAYLAIVMGVVLIIVPIISSIHSYRRMNTIENDIRDKTDNLTRDFNHRLKLNTHEFKKTITKKTNEYQELLQKKTSKQEEIISKQRKDLVEKIENVENECNNLLRQKDQDFSNQIQTVTDEIDKTKELENSVNARYHILKSSQLIITLNGLNEFHNKHFLKEEKGKLVTYMLQESKQLLDKFIEKIDAVERPYLNILFLLILEQLRNFINLYEPYIYNPRDLKQIFVIRDTIAAYSDKICQGEDYNPAELGNNLSNYLFTLHRILEYEFHINSQKK